ncbi:hypothetical protein G3I59_27015 [Amycolatopsis rubida]|uniref:Uncharacterized protein n=1 Tax=Amycolatopsis rubida TaxID=112413 RepID=A0ABX0BU56_9PSEU|nr:MULTISPECIES: hypothetical protein [Amycolatopsis]MYW94163.1 hypothetical protein [Amycolatopsis rubida]NEC59152.1 hypothetical protein [Amycolatopsis rubida]OAP20922.1 hypothetical protein A4R44_08368 [Amycolatopsis sp. M39]
MTERLDPYELIADDEWGDAGLLGPSDEVFRARARSTADATGRGRRARRPDPAGGAADVPSEDAREGTDAA